MSDLTLREKPRLLNNPAYASIALALSKDLGKLAALRNATARLERDKSIEAVEEIRKILEQCVDAEPTRQALAIPPTTNANPFDPCAEN